MPTFTLPYGKETQVLTLPETMRVDLIDPAEIPARGDPLEIVAESLLNPMGERRLEDFRRSKTVAIAVNDKTRPVPHHVLLPPLLKRLEALDFDSGSVRFFIATGTHTPMPPFEFSRVLSEEIISRYPVISHDSDDLNNLASLGTTSRGTQVSVNREYYEADLKIVVGNIEPHHFAGFSGGMKTAAIGLTGRDTINQNHAMLLDPMACIGEYERNPLRQDIEEIGQRIGVDFALNVILNAEKRVVKSFFGDPMAVMRAGIPESRRLSQTTVPEMYDLVIASAGGHPKDINFYQAQKGLTYASQITREGGTMILVAACPEGSGSESYERFMEGVDSYEGVFEKFRKEGFRVGPHKAIQVALIASRKRVILVSQIPPNWIYRWLMIPAPDVQAAVELALPRLPPQPRIAILPHATNTIPLVAASTSPEG